MDLDTVIEAVCLNKCDNDRVSTFQSLVAQHSFNNLQDVERIVQLMTFDSGRQSVMDWVLPKHWDLWPRATRVF